MKLRIINKDGATLKTKGKYCAEDIVISIDKDVLGVDTSDATAEAADILLGKTGYVNGIKITGTMEDYNSEYEGNIAIGIHPEGNLEITSTEEVDVTNYATVSINEPNLKAENILKDVNILGITGTCRPYGEPKLQEKTVTQNGEVLPDNEYDGLSKVTVTNLNCLKNVIDETKSCTSLFNCFSGADVSDYISYEDTSNAASTYNMFNNCNNLTTIPLLDTSKVTGMSNMFNGCTSLTTIPQLDTSNVTDMNNMFRGCSSLTTIPQLDTSNVTNMSSMFYSCKNLTTIPQLDTSNVTDMNNMFYWNSRLRSVSQLNTSNTNNMNSLFYWCFALKTIPQLDTYRTTTAKDMFTGCNNLESIDLTYYNLGENGSSNLFKECKSLKSIVIREFGPNYYIAPNAFTDCHHLTGFNDSSWGIPYNPNGEKDCVIKVPDAMVDILKSTAVWSDYADQIIGINDVQILEDIRAYGQAQTKNMTIRLYRNTNAPTSVSITSNNENITTITNIVTSVDRITFDLNFTGNLGSSAISVAVVGDNNANYTFNASFVNYIPPTYTVEKVSGASGGFELNSDGYYENKNGASYSAMSKLIINNTNKDIPVKLTLECIQNSFSAYHFSLISKMDTTLSWADVTDFENVYEVFKTEFGVTTVLKNVVYDLPQGEHFIYIKYQHNRGIGNSAGSNSLKFKVHFNI